MVVALCVYALMALAEIAGTMVRVGRWPGWREFAVFAALSALWPIALANRVLRRTAAWLRDWAFDTDSGGM